MSPNEIDDIIERALSGYSDSEPIAGLDERVLSRIPVAAVAGRSFTGLWWAALTACLVVGLVFVGIAIRTRPVAYTPVPEKSIAAPTPAPFVHSVVRKSRRRTRVRRALVAKALPKQEKFPAPSAMTDEERALVAFVDRDPAQALQVFAELAENTKAADSAQ